MELSKGKAREEHKMLSEKQIEELEAKGAKRWTKGTMDRLYFNATSYGIEYDRYKSGNISQSRYIDKDGEDHGLSHAACGRILAAKLWVDVADGKLYSKYAPTNDWQWDDIVSRVEEDVNEVMA